LQYIELAAIPQSQYSIVSRTWISYLLEPNKRARKPLGLHVTSVQNESDELLFATPRCCWNFKYPSISFRTASGSLLLLHTCSMMRIYRGIC